MNKNLNTAIRCRSSEQGFALPIAVGMGFVMILIATTLLIRSNGDRVTASAQEDTAGSLSLVEVGITRTLSAFKQNSTLASVIYDSSSGVVWGDASLSGTGGNRWIAVSTDGEKIGHFKIYKYTPDTTTGIGTLEILGTTDTNTAPLQITNQPQKAISSLEVEIAYELPAINPPGLAINAWRRKEAP